MAVAEDKYFSWDYSEKSDILNVRKLGKKTAGSAELGDFTVDFDKNGNIVGVEIMNASEFLSPLQISKDQLTDIKSAELIIRKSGQYNLIHIKLLLPQKIEKIISIPAPVLAEATA